MALSEFEEKKAALEVERFMESKRLPENMRNQLDFGYRIENQSVVLFEIRSIQLPDKPEKKIEAMVAKATYVKTERVWKVYWQRADLQWHRYEPVSEVRELSDFLNLVDEDKHGCFWG